MMIRTLISQACTQKLQPFWVIAAVKQSTQDNVFIWWVNSSTRFENLVSDQAISPSWYFFTSSTRFCLKMC